MSMSCEECYIPDIYKKPILVFGCGNILFGDDGFGPEVISYLEKNYKIPKNVCVMNVGTSIRDILFTLILGEQKPKKIIIVDAVDKGKEAGEIFEISLEEISDVKIDDFSIHMIPSSNLLKELRDFCNVEVIILACQVEKIPKQVEPGLSKSVKLAIPKMCKEILKRLNLNLTSTGYS